MPTAKVEAAPLPPLPDEKSAAIPAVAPPSPIGELPPLPSENSTNTLDQALKPADTQAVVPAPANTKVAVAEKTKKYVKRHATTHLAMHRKNKYFVSERLPSTIYKKHYDAKNRHLPVARYEEEYDALLFLTAEHDDLNGLRAMLGTGRSVNIVDRAGDTPLLAAVKHNAINTARLLLARHANPNAEDRSGMTALAIATRMGNYPMIRALQEMGAHPVEVSSNE